jgi:two-component system, cell cycle sensor histidine kinase and response regulator CckA
VSSMGDAEAPWLFVTRRVASMLPEHELPMHALPGVEIVPFRPDLLHLLPAPLAAVILDARKAPLESLMAACRSSRLATVPRFVLASPDALDLVADALDADDADDPTSMSQISFARRLRALVELGCTRLTLSLVEQALERGVTGLSISDSAAPDTPLVHVTPAFERLTGYKRDEVLGQNCRLLSAEDDHDEARSRLRGAIARRIPVRVVLRNARKDGRLFWNDLTVFPFHAQGVELPLLGGIQHDVTDRIEAEQEIERLAEERVQRLKLEQDGLRRVERLAAMGTMVAGFAHEVRNPVAALRAMTEQLDEDLAEVGHHVPHVARMLQALGRIERLVDTSLQFGRPAAPQRAEHRAWTIISTALATLSPRLRTMDGEIRLEVEPSLPSIFVDDSQLVQVLVILLNNALDATCSPRRVLLRAVSASTHAERDAPRSSAPPPGVRFEVIDDGPGIQPDVMGQIFDPFFTTKVTGTGLGLSIAQQLVSENEARLEVSSVPNIKTIFTVICSVATF